jgi:hypothetical protein
MCEHPMNIWRCYLVPCFNGNVFSTSYSYLCTAISRCWLVGDYLLLRDLGPYGIIFMKICVCVCVCGEGGVITIATVNMLRACALWESIYDYVCLML